MQIALLMCAVLLQIMLTGNPPSVQDALNGVIIMAPILFLFLATLGRGMGFGDVKLAFTMGYLLGWKGGVIALYIAFVSGAAVGIVLLLLKRRGMKSKIAFGPFLVIGLVISLLFQTQILSMLSRFIF
jgi:leader peptidase (prepilin peptidase)/N-methyltransferase